MVSDNKRFYSPDERHKDHMAAVRRGEMYDELSAHLNKLVRKNGLRDVLFVLEVLTNDMKGNP